ncbi:hypothetical protein [Blastococcus deserti]|uniref:Uncharacterized protein n=1 Tax=Blastococcus deserti TaxID=2259033 RepID=A0ABW4XFS9_9ACTN
MDTDDRHRLCENARVRGELTVQELWLRYLALGGLHDEFDVDGYLQGVLPLNTLEQDILAVALNERLDEIYRAARGPVASAMPDASGTNPSPGLIEELLDRYQSSSGATGEPD